MSRIRWIALLRELQSRQFHGSKTVHNSKSFHTDSSCLKVDYFFWRYVIITTKYNFIFNCTRRRESLEIFSSLSKDDSSERRKKILEWRSFYCESFEGNKKERKESELELQQQKKTDENDLLHNGRGLKRREKFLQINLISLNGFFIISIHNPLADVWFHVSEISFNHICWLCLDFKTVKSAEAIALVILFANWKTVGWRSSYKFSFSLSKPFFIHFLVPE